ncbi:MAG: PEGA domain-containing protein [Deltaproteobacteria bacterium]|nr:PEGA domain-containing protein [Deltaproteobacteria bacterium]
MIPVLLALAAACPPIAPEARVAVVVRAPDPGLSAAVPAVERRLRAVAAERLTLASEEATLRALSAEGGARARDQALVTAKAQLAQAEARFKELDDEGALARITEVTTKLVPVHQAEGATALLAEAHLLAAAVYLARGQLDAVQVRLQRALDLAPDLVAPRHRFDPRLAAELAAAKDARGLRATGRLEVVVPPEGPGGMVFLDGHPVGPAPLVLDAVPAGRHLLRISAQGYASQLRSLDVPAADTRTVEARLAPDPEHHVLARLGTDAPEATALLVRRAGVEHALVAEVVLAPRLGPAATGTVAVRLVLSDRGAGYAPDASPEALAAALDAALACAPPAWPALLAPALPGPIPSRASAEVVPGGSAWWRAPWVWAVAAGVVLGAAGALVAAKASAGPPDAVSLTLIPRP